METFSPTRELTRVDLPELGRPIMVTNPDRPILSGIFVFGFCFYFNLGNKVLHAEPVNSSTIGIQYFNGNPAMFDLLTAGRQAAEQLHHGAGNGRAFRIFHE